MTNIVSNSRRWASLVTAVGLAAALAGCATTDLGDMGKAVGPSAGAATGDKGDAESSQTPNQSAAHACFPGMWEMDNSTMSDMLASIDILVSDSIEGTALVVAYPDGTAKVEFINWTYEVKAPPNPMLGGQAPTTQTITNDSSSTATFDVGADGLITVTRDDDADTTKTTHVPSVFSCDGNQLFESVESLGGEIVYNRRS